MKLRFDDVMEDLLKSQTDFNADIDRLLYSKLTEKVKIPLAFDTYIRANAKGSLLNFRVRTDDKLQEYEL
jgi:hypothetical protein